MIPKPDFDQFKQRCAEAGIPVTPVTVTLDPAIVATVNHYLSTIELAHQNAKHSTCVFK
jgi:hypothetical protein